MEKKSIVLLLLVLAIMPMISAFNVEVIIQTTPGTQIDFNVLNRETGRILDSVNGVFHETAGSDGKVLINYSADFPIIKASITAKKGEEFVEFKQGNTTKPMLVYDNLMAQGTNNINLLNPEEPKLVFEKRERENVIIETKEEIKEVEVNETAQEKVNETQEAIKEEIVKETEKTAESGSKLTGAIIGGVKSLASSKITYFVIGGLFLVVIGVLILRKIKSKKDTYLNFKFKSGKSPGLVGSTGLGVGYDDTKLIDIEKRIEEARKGLEEIKNRKTRLEDVKARLERDKEELRKLEEDR